MAANAFARSVCSTRAAGVNVLSIQELNKRSKSARVFAGTSIEPKPVAGSAMPASSASSTCKRYIVTHMQAEVDVLIHGPCGLGPHLWHLPLPS
jgi:hypothetical protein